MEKNADWLTRDDYLKRILKNYSNLHPLQRGIKKGQYSIDISRFSGYG